MYTVKQTLDDFNVYAVFDSKATKLAFEVIDNAAQLKIGWRVEEDTSRAYNSEWKYYNSVMRKHCTVINMETVQAHAKAIEECSTVEQLDAYMHKFADLYFEYK